jgi:hypothetical protein
MTSQAEWNPHSDDFETQEQTLREASDFGITHPQNDERLVGQIIASSITSSPFQFPNPKEISPCLTTICSATSTQRKPSIAAEALAKQWGIGLDTAQRTLNATTQLAIRQAIHPLQ